MRRLAYFMLTYLHESEEIERSRIGQLNRHTLRSLHHVPVGPRPSLTLQYVYEALTDLWRHIEHRHQ